MILIIILLLTSTNSSAEPNTFETSEPAIYTVFGSYGADYYNIVIELNFTVMDNFEAVISYSYSDYYDEIWYNHTGFHRLEITTRHVELTVETFEDNASIAGYFEVISEEYTLFYDGQFGGLTYPIYVVLILIPISRMVKRMKSDN